eukprot:4276343-Prymnesium_polylepis.1
MVEQQPDRVELVLRHELKVEAHRICHQPFDHAVDAFTSEPVEALLGRTTVQSATASGHTQSRVSRCADQALTLKANGLQLARSLPSLPMKLIMPVPPGALWQSCGRGTVMGTQSVQSTVRARACNESRAQLRAGGPSRSTAVRIESKRSAWARLRGRRAHRHREQHAGQHACARHAFALVVQQFHGPRGAHTILGPQF